MKNSKRTFHKHLSYSFHTEHTLNYKHKPHKRFKDPHPKKVCKSIYKHIKHYIQENFQFLLSFSATKKGSNQEKIRERERERERLLTNGRGLRRSRELREHEFSIRQLENDGYGSWVRMRTEPGNFLEILFFIFKIIVYLYGSGWIIPVDKWAFDMSHHQVKLGISQIKYYQFPEMQFKYLFIILFIYS